MKSKKLLFILSIFFAFTLIFTGCSKEKTEDKTPPTDTETVTLKVLYSAWPPDMISYIAQEKGFFEKHGVNVELVWDNGLSEASKIRKEQNINIWAYPLLDFLTDYTQGNETEAQVIMIEDFSAGADAVITLPEKNLKTVADLKGKNIGVEKGTIGEFFLQILLQRKGLKLDDVNAIDTPFDAVPAGLKDGTIDAGVTYEPVITESVAEGAVVLVDSKMEKNTIVDVFVAKKKHIEENKEAYVAFIRAILEAGEYLRDNPEDTAELIKDKLEMTKEEVLETFEKLKIPDLRENKIAFDRSSGHESLYNLARLAQDFLERDNPDLEEIELEPLLNSSLMNSIKE